MKPLHISSITYYIRTYAALCTPDMNAIMSYYFLSQRYERDHVLFIKVVMTSKTPHQMLFMLRNLAIKMTIIWK